jgi:hypothetical protein
VQSKEFLMKRAFKLIGITAFCAVLCFSMAVCEQYTDDEDVTFLNANSNSMQTTTELILVFSKAVNGLAAADITVNLGGMTVTNGKLSGGNPYSLPISGFTTGGTATITVAKKEGFNIIGTPQTATIYYGGSTNVTFSGVSANGNSTQTTTELTLTFSGSINGLSANDISLNGVNGVIKGNLTGTNPYYLPISGFAMGGTLSVSVSKDGYTIAGGSRSTTIYSSGGSNAVTFNSVTVSSSADGTNSLTLTFNGSITGLTASDISLSGVSGVNKGNLTGTNPYYLTISGITSNGTLSVSVTKAGYAITPQIQTVEIRVITFSNVTSDGSPNVTPTEWLTLSFSGPINGLESSDIKLDGVDGIGQGELKESNPYKLFIFGFNAPGTLTVSVTKTGYIIIGSPKTVNIHYATPVIEGINDFGKWLSGLQANAADSPYSVKLQVGDLGGAVSTANSVGSHLFANNEKYIDLDLSISTFTSIDDNAFSSCSGLTRVTIPSTVADIGNSAFFGCTSLTSVTFIDTSVTSIGQAAFSGCSSLASVTIPDKVKTIELAAFFGCASLVSVTIPAAVTGIGPSAFSGCVKLDSVSLGNSVTTIDADAFSGCVKLANISLGENVKTIDTNAFSGCASLVSFALPASLETIGASAFFGCAKLINITIPATVTGIGARAFTNCTSLASVTFEAGINITSIEQSAFAGCASLLMISIPSFVKTIGPSAFLNCVKLGGISFSPDATVDSIAIEASAFSGCTTIKKVTIPEEVNSIGNSAFANCTSLINVKFDGSGILTADFGTTPFPGDLREKYLTGGTGTYERPEGSNTWAKQLP